MKHNLLKSVILSVILLMGVSNAWGAKGFFGTGQWNIQYWDGYSDKWGSNASGYKDASSLDLGIQTKLYLINGWVKTWSDNDWTQSEVIWYWGWTSGSTTNNWKAYKNSEKGDLTWYFDTDYDLIGNAPNNPGHNTLYMYWRLDDYVQSSTSTITFTIPGFTSTNIDYTFDYTTVNTDSPNTKKIEFTHYGTALTQNNCALTGTHSGDFKITKIEESGVTVAYTPKGNQPSNTQLRSAVLTIKDAHGKECRINLTGRTRSIIKYYENKNDNLSNRAHQGYKNYGSTYRIEGSGANFSSNKITREGYTQVAWETKNETRYEFNAEYKTEAHLNLYPIWTPNTYTVVFNANNGSGTMANQAFTYDAAQNLSTNTFTRTGYTFAGWNTNADGTGTSYTNIQSVSNLTAVNNGIVTLYAKWTANTYTVTLDPQGGSNGSTSTSAKSGVAMSAITPPTRDGYIFEGYYSEPNGQGKKYYNADGSSANLWDKENATLYAKWVEYAKCIFFKNNLNWTNIYVYTFKGDVWGNDGKGVYPENRHEYGTMTKIGDTDVYYYILNESNEFNYIAFSDYDMSSHEPFWGYNAVYRGDHVPGMQLFIPQQSQSSSSVNESTTKYYNEGVWMKYNSTESGYYLNISGESNTQFTTQTAGGYDFSTTIYLTENKTKTIDITNICPNTKFSKTQTTSNSGEWTLDQWGDFYAASTWNFTSSITGPYTFNINIETGQVKVKAIYPTLVEPETGDYRLIYIEQVVEKSTDENQEWKTVHTLKKLHPSNIIKRRTISGVDTVSLHVYNGRTYQAVKNPKAINDQDKYYSSSSNSEVILQRYNGSSWENKERHMVFGPLETLPSMAMLPGRRNTEGNTTLKYDKGIKVIQEDEKNSGNGVWNFPIAQTVNGSEVAATLERDGIKRYSGKYYIRTANSVGGWNNYTIPENHMTHSLYAESNNEFTHYYCKWIDINKGSRYVQFVVANDFGQAISDTLVADRATLLGVALAEGERMVGDDGLLPASANVRFSWKEDNNALHRAYLNGSGEADADYLVVRDASNGNGHGLYTFDNNGNRKLTDNKKTFSDNGGWMYHADVRAETLAPVTITATYNGKKQYFKGSDSETQPIIAGNANDTRKHPIRILYDFKENRYFTAYVPTEAVTEDVAIETDVMIIRRNHEEANQLQLTPSPRVINEGKTAYGAITFTKDFLSSNSWTVTNDKKFYWISFPFDVKLSEAFGFGKYAVHWYIEYYDGKSRAENGLFYESGTYWKYVTKSMAADYVLEANKGYLLWLNVPRVQSDNFFAGDITEISIYFPSKESIDPSYESYSNVECTLEPLWRPEGSRRYYDDSNWHLIGVPSYANTTETTQQDNAKFVYDYIAATDTYEPKSSAQIGNFKSMFAYMVQYTGNINWSTIINDHNPAQKAIIAQQKSSDNNEHLLRLELQQNGSKSDQTFIQLQEQDVTTKFDMNHDLCKIINAGANIYTIITEEQEPIQVAANLLPDSESIIPVGIKLDTAGEYTFAMPDGTDGIVVELIDYENNTRTNMLLDEYTVNLSKGTFDNRFALHVKPDKTTTSVDNIGDEATGDKVKKYLIDGILYMQKDGVLYDAQGKLVR